MKYAVEFIGTFMFLSVILSHPEPIPIAIALAAVIFFGATVSGAHYNPAVSVMMAMDGRMPVSEMIGYILAQVAGAAVALLVYNKYIKNKK
uniref:Major intrinsic protein n=1 Tax=viral metagenome TaxID=1070528 RepID=A0A6C0KCN3_9ZZZZ